MVSAATFAVAWIANYDPLEPGARGFHPQDDRMRVIEVDALGASGRVFVLPASGPTRFRYTFSITNTGPMGVSIERVGPPAEEQLGEVTRQPVRVLPSEQVYHDDALHPLVFQPWHPFVLRPGQQALIEMEVTFDPRICLPRNTSLTWWPETIAFSVLGLARETTFESDLEVRIVETENCDA